MQTVQYISMNEEALKLFGQLFPNLEASRRIGSIDVVEVICSNCEQELIIPTDSFSQYQTEKEYRYGIENMIEYDDLVFCSDECQRKYMEQNGIRYTFCDMCGDSVHEDDTTCVEIYDSPFDQYTDCAIACERCADDEYSESFECLECGRRIRYSSPSHPAHSNGREVEDDILCLSCYEEMLLEEGVDAHSFLIRIISGMFFSSNNIELTDAGWEVVEDYEDFYISENTKDEYCNKALALIDKGYMIINAYERLSILGDEGMVSMFCKKKN